jgi:hypothetical protein
MQELSRFLPRRWRLSHGALEKPDPKTASIVERLKIWIWARRMAQKTWKRP